MHGARLPARAPAPRHVLTCLSMALINCATPDLGTLEYTVHTCIQYAHVHVLVHGGTGTPELPVLPELPDAYNVYSRAPQYMMYGHTYCNILKFTS